MREGTRACFGVIVGSRGFFNPKLAAEGRQSLLTQLETLGYEAVVMPEDATPNGAVETSEDALKYARYFDERKDRIHGFIVSLPNFGDELGIVHTLSETSVKAPVLVQAFNDEIDKVDVANRRDAFCGKISVCNNLRQYGISFSDTTAHTCDVTGADFAADLEKFAGVCRVVQGLRKARIGQVGTRPAPFQTMRASEKLLQASGITVVPVDFSEILFPAMRMDETAEVKAQMEAMQEYGSIPSHIPRENIVKQAKLSVKLNEWIRENAIDAAGVQCWTSVQQNYGCAVCTTMSMLGELLVPCACEADIGGAVGMYALTLATGNPSALLDWNNNYGDDPDRCVGTHCSNFPKGFINADIEISNLDVLGEALGPGNCFGGIKGKVQPGPMSFARVDTDDLNGVIRAYTGNGEFTDDPFDMAGGIAVCRIPELRKLLKLICAEGFEHHVGMARGQCADVLEEAFTKYLGWQTYRHA